MTYTLEQIKKLYERDNEVRKGNKSANKAIIKLVEIIGKPQNTIGCEPTKGGTIPNRGSVVECLVKMLLLKAEHTDKYGAGETDMELNGKDYEIKYSSPKGYASYSGTIKSDVIFVDQYGMYKAKPQDLIFDKCGRHIQTINKSKSITLLAF